MSKGFCSQYYIHFWQFSNIYDVNKSTFYDEWYEKKQDEVKNIACVQKEQSKY